jgi:hypothetical protein
VGDDSKKSHPTQERDQPLLALFACVSVEYRADCVAAFLVTSPFMR